MVSSKKNKKEWKIKRKWNRMWCGCWKWCRYEKNKKLRKIKIKEIKYNVM